jgi:hypothetical protein
MRECAIVNLSTRRGWYDRGQERLYRTVEEFGENLFDFISFYDEGQIGAPKHELNPYAFKIYAIAYALKKGYKKIVWCDSSLYAVKSLQPVYEALNSKGYLMEMNGHNAGRWTNDKCLNYFGLSRTEADNIKLYSAGFTGLNFEVAVCRDFFKDWMDSMLAGCFVGNWSDHRHDQSCASIIASKHGMEYTMPGTFLSYVGPGYNKPHEQSVFHLKPA